VIASAEEAAADGRAQRPQDPEESDVEDELVALLQRQREALELVEARLRALELLVAADEQRFIASALDELEVASERLAALELGRVLVLGSAGFPPDVSAEELLVGLGAVDGDDEGALDLGRFAGILEALRVAVARVAIARERAMAVLGPGADATRQRLVAAGAYAGV
jgi:hypothetical protein